MRKERKKQPAYICHDCAKTYLKEKFAPGMGFTIHMGKCDICKNERPLAHVSDYRRSSDVEWD